MKLKTLPLVALSLVALSGCGNANLTAMEAFLKEANALNAECYKGDAEHHYSNILVQKDDDGKFVMYFNADFNPVDVGDLEAARSSMNENLWFGYLGYDESDPENMHEAANSIQKTNSGELLVTGEIGFVDVDGNGILLEDIEEGAMFAGKSRYNHSYISPVERTFSEIVYLGQVEPLDFSWTPIAE